MKHSKSAAKTVTWGVPHGSILSPIFIVICINGLPNVSYTLFSVMLAHNVIYYIEGRNSENNVRVLNKEQTKLTI